MLCWAQRRDHLCLAGPPAAILRADYSCPFNREVVRRHPAPSAVKNLLPKRSCSRIKCTLTDAGRDDLELPRKNCLKFPHLPKQKNTQFPLKLVKIKKYIKTSGFLGRRLTRNFPRVSVSEIGWSVLTCGQGCSSIQCRV